MADEYYIATDGQTEGPFTRAQLDSMSAQGLISVEARYWCEGMGDWQVVSDLFAGSTVHSDSSASSPKPIPRAVESKPPRLSAEHFPMAIHVSGDKDHDGTLIIAVVALTIIITGFWYFLAPSHDARSKAGAAISKTEAIPMLSVADLNASDQQSSVELLKPEHFRFKKGGFVDLKANAPLFFNSEYFQDAKAAMRYQVLYYDAKNKRVYLRSQDTNGKDVALNVLESYVRSSADTSAPVGSIVRVNEKIESNLLVSYDDTQQIIPIADTDYLQRATKQRLEALQQAEEEHQRIADERHEQERRQFEVERQAKEKLERNQWHETMGVILIIGLWAVIITTGLIIYFAPSIIGRNKTNAQAIFVLNLFTGWSFIGWVLALVWAFTKDSAMDTLARERISVKDGPKYLD
jgi:hypothetical protein